MTRTRIERILLVLTVATAMATACLMAQGCTHTVLPPPGSPTVTQLPLEQLTPKQQLTIGWQTYNKLWEDYARLRQLKDPSQAEIKLMTSEYQLIQKSYPMLIKATEAFEANQPLSVAVIEIIRELMLSVRF